MTAARPWKAAECAAHLGYCTKYFLRVVRWRSTTSRTRRKWRGNYDGGHMRYCEEWIERKLRDRLNLYKRRYPMFDVERVMQTVETWDEKSQRWSPYMDDKDIRGINKRYHRAQSIRSLCENEHI